MEFIQQWSRGLVALVVLMGLVELLLPQDTLRPYVRMVLGLLVIVALVRPVIHELPGLKTWEPRLKTVAEGDLEQITRTGIAIRERGRDEAEKVIRENVNLEEHIHRNIPELQVAGIQQDGDSLRIWVAPATSRFRERQLVELLTNLGWDEKRIEVNRDDR